MKTHKELSVCEFFEMNGADFFDCDGAGEADGIVTVDAELTFSREVFNAIVDESRVRGVSFNECVEQLVRESF